MLFFLYEAFRIVKFIETEWKSGVRDWGGVLGSYCLIGMEFQFCKMKQFSVGWWSW